MEIFGKTVPPQWLDVLSLVHSLSPEALLAGGCIRDLVLGGPVKDLDIFVDASSDDHWSDLCSVLQFRHGWCPVTQINADYVASMRSEVAKVVGFRVPGFPLEVQIIGLKTLLYPMDALNRMDFGACQIGMSHHQHVFYTPAAHKDLTERRITMLEPGDATQELRSLRRAERFAEKYRYSDVIVLRTGPSARFAADFPDTWTDGYDEALGG